MPNNCTKEIEVRRERTPACQCDECREERAQAHANFMACCQGCSGHYALEADNRVTCPIGKFGCPVLDMSRQMYTGAVSPSECSLMVLDQMRRGEAKPKKRLKRVGKRAWNRELHVVPVPDDQVDEANLEARNWGRR